MSDTEAVQFPELSVAVGGGGIDVDKATAVLVGAALAALIGLRLSFPKGR